MLLIHCTLSFAKSKLLLFFIFIVFTILHPNILSFIGFDENIVLIKIVYLSDKQAKNIMAVNSKLIWIKLFCLKMFFFINWYHY